MFQNLKKFQFEKPKNQHSQYFWPASSLISNPIQFVIPKNTVYLLAPTRALQSKMCCNRDKLCKAFLVHIVAVYNLQLISNQSKTVYNTLLIFTQSKATVPQQSLSITVIVTIQLRATQRTQANKCNKFNKCSKQWNVRAYPRTEMSFALNRLICLMWTLQRHSELNELMLSVDDLGIRVYWRKFSNFKL